MSGEHRRLQARGFVIRSPTELQVTRPERYKVGEYVELRPQGEVRLVVQIDGDRITVAPALCSETVRAARNILAVTTYQDQQSRALQDQVHNNLGIALSEGTARAIVNLRDKPSSHHRKAEPLPEPGERFIDLSEEE